jgi:hypothetical protein
MNKARFEGRNEYTSDALGDPPDWMQDTPTYKPRAAWRLFEVEVPWLRQRDRGLVEMACTVRGKLIAGIEPPGVQALQLLRMCLSQMGATPSDATKVGAPKSDDDKKDDDDILSQP